MNGVPRVPLFAAMASVWCVALAAADKPCETVVGVLATEFVFKVPSARLARVEIRQCSPDGSASIQLAAWRSGDTAPALVVDTADFGVVQAAARANVFVVETGGATRDQVFVIVYYRGEPRLALRRTTKGTARINMSDSAIDLVIEGIYAGDAPPRTESQHFVLSSEEVKLR
jgi:hypothetical protein